MSSIGDCFVVILNSNSSESTVIFGRNSLQQDNEIEGVAQEVYYYSENDATNDEKEELHDVEKCRIVLQKPCPGIWGGDCGSNEKISIGVSWASSFAEEQHDDGYYSVTDIIRLTLATSMSVENAVERIGQLAEKHSHDNLKFSVVVCDSIAAWIVNCCGKLWAAQRLADGCHHLPSNGFTIRTEMHASSHNLNESLKALQLYDGECELDFAACFGVVGTLDMNWCGNKPSDSKDDGSFTITDMFHTLRMAASEASPNNTRSGTVFVWKHNVSSHWFTATPHTNESVFKPFVFSPNPIISPLTKVPTGERLTLLHKLHSQRKPTAMDNLKELEKSCVDEVNRYLRENPSNNELDELMKDCVEAEVKFYR